MKDLHERLLAHPNRRMRFCGLDGKLVTRTFTEVHGDVSALADALRAAGLGAGDLVGVAGPNSYEWVLADIALLALGCVPVALAVEGAGAPSPVELADKYHLNALLLTTALSGGGELPPHVAVLGAEPPTLRARETTRTELPADVFTVAFSSGTSGSKKGLMLSTSGVVNTIEVSAAAWELTGDDDILIVLPFSNFQQRYLLYTAVTYGTDVTVVAPERMLQMMRKLEPTVILGPPSFFELVDNRVQSATGRERLAYWAAAALHAVLPDALGRSFRRRLGRTWTAVYGGRVRLMFTGSAPVPPGMVRTFHRLGMPLYEVYGSTEVGWIAMNTPRAFRIGSAGVPVPGLEVTLGADGEVLVRTDRPQSLGYVFEGVDSYAEVYRDDGLIATGDLATRNRAGFLRLVGRTKNVIITRSGVKINPEELEQELERSCRIERAVVAAPEANGLLVCVVWLDDWESAERRADVERHVAAANARRDTAHRITDVVFRPAAELTVESGLLTRNLKVNRTAVARKVFPVLSGRDR